MVDPRQLTMGVDIASPTQEEEIERKAVLRATIDKYLPEFVAGIAKAAEAKDAKDSTMLLHQDAFASGYDDDEYTLLGMAIKYAGLHGVTVTVIGKNHDTI